MRSRAFKMSFLKHSWRFGKLYSAIKKHKKAKREKLYMQDYSKDN